MSLINQKLEKILTDWMKTLSFGYGISFYSGIDIGEPGNEPIMDLPRCVISCPNATERIKDTGTNDVDLEIRITHSADDATRDEHVTMCSEILDAVTGAGNLVTFNQTVDFHIYDIYPVSSQMEMDGRNWSTVINIQIVGLARNGFVAP